MNRDGLCQRLHFLLLVLVLTLVLCLAWIAQRYERVRIPEFLKHWALTPLVETLLLLNALLLIHFLFTL